MNPANLFRKGVAALNDWFEKTEREEMEQRMEIARPPSKSATPPPPPEPLARKRRDLDGSNVLDFTPSERADAAGISEVMRAEKSRESHATPRPSSASGFDDSDHGIKTPSPADELFARRNDTHYKQRNRLVRKIGERYSRFGDTVASAVLQKCLIDDGVQLLVTKLGGIPEGDDNADHQQIVDYIEEHGSAKFCELLGVRIHSREGDRHGHPSGDKFKLAQNVQGKAGVAGKDHGESHVLQIQRVNVKPISLPAAEEESERRHVPSPNATPLPWMSAAKSSDVDVPTKISGTDTTGTQAPEPTPVPMVPPASPEPPRRFMASQSTPLLKEPDEPKHTQPKDMSPVPLRRDSTEANKLESLSSVSPPPRQQTPPPQVAKVDPLKPAALLRPSTPDKPPKESDTEPPKEDRTALDYLREVTEEDD